MGDMHATAASIGGIALLERAINYTLGVLPAVTPAALSRPTPCRDWDLGALLRHLDDALVALTEAAGGRVEPPAPDAGLPGVPDLRARARQLLGAWACGGDRPVSIGGCPLTTGLVTGTGALEVAVHGWDVAWACGPPRPIPPALADELLDLAPLLVRDADRPGRFAAPIPVPATAGPAERLLAFLGRQPA